MADPRLNGFKSSLMDRNVPSQLSEEDLAAEMEIEIPDSQKLPRRRRSEEKNRVFYALQIPPGFRLLRAWSHPYDWRAVTRSNFCATAANRRGYVVQRQSHNVRNPNASRLAIGIQIFVAL